MEDTHARRSDDVAVKSEATVPPVQQRPADPTSAPGVVLDRIIKGDSIKVLQSLPEGWADLVFADPPFNIGYLYQGYSDRKSTEEYLAFSEDWMRAVHRALKPKGSFFLAIGDDFAADLCVIARRSIGFHMRNWIIWHYTFGQQTTRKFARSHTHIFYFTKSSDLSDITFNADEVRVASARQTVYKDVRANSKGKLPDDTWFLRPQEAAAEANFFDENSDTWNISRVCGTFKEREGWHGCQMPRAVLERIIRAASNPGDVVLDPFNGSGTTTLCAASLGRRYVGIEQSAEYVKYARQRLVRELPGMSVDRVATKRATAPEKVQTPTNAFGRPRVTRSNKRPKLEQPDKQPLLIADQF